MDHNEDLTVLICTWNRARLLSQTLDSVAALIQPAGLRWSVVVVDNNSTDDTARIVRSRARDFPVPLRYLFEPGQGKSSAMNAGIRESRAPVIAFADDDIQLSDGWLQAVTRAFGGHPEIAYIGGPVNPIWEAPPPRWFDDTGKALWGALAILDYGDAPFVFEDQRKIPVGANFAVRRMLFDRVGGFDPGLGRNSDRVLLGQELPELFARARAAGLRGMYVPEMRVAHHVPAKRLTPGYLRRWWYGKGVSRARLEAIHPITELGLDLRQVPTLAGIPRFLVGDAARDAIRWTTACLHRDAGRRILAETRLCYFLGQLRERRRLAARSWNGRLGDRPDIQSRRPSGHAARRAESAGRRSLV